MVKTNKLTVAYFGDTNTEEYSEIYLDVIHYPTVKEKFTFYHLDDKECGAKFGVTSTPALVVFRHFDNPVEIYEGKWEVFPLIDFLIGSS